VLRELFPKKAAKACREETQRLHESLESVPEERKQAWVDMEAQSKQVCDAMYVPSSYDPEQPEEPYFPGHFRVMEVHGRKKVPSADRVRSMWMTYNFEAKFLVCCRMRPRQWIPVPIGDGSKRRAPVELLTDVPLKYVQKEQESLCLYYSLASVLHYLGWRRAARDVCKLGMDSQHLPGKDQVGTLLAHLQASVPQFGRTVKYNKATSSKGTRVLDLEDLIRNKTTRPLVLIPLACDGQVSHAVCIIDDLVFDSTQQRAMKLIMDSLHWSCGRCGFESVWEAYLLTPHGCKEDKRRPITHF